MSIKKGKKESKPKAPVGKKETVGNSLQKAPKYKLVSYTMGAVIPVGNYANIQPSLTIEAESLEVAERIAIGHIEEMFKKYRSDGSQKPPVIQPAQVPVSAKPATYEDAKKAGEALLKDTQPAPKTETPAPTAIVLSEPFKRAKGAIESCTGHDALKLVEDQIVKSVKLIDSEKEELKNLVTVKRNDITIAKTA